MVLSGKVDGEEGMTGGEPVQASIGGYGCVTGDFVRAAPRGQGGIDSYAIIVLPYEVDPHCGRDGDRVTIAIGTRRAAGDLRWHEGLVTADLSLESVSGSARDSSGERWTWFGLGTLAGAGGLALLGAAALLVLGGAQRSHRLRSD